MDLSQEIKRKTQQLIFLKSNYNAQVEDIDKEISLKKQIIEEMVIHFPLSLARQCLSLLKKNPPDNKTASTLLKQFKQQQMESESSFYEEEEYESEYFDHHNINSQKTAQSSSFSSEDSLEDDSFHFDN